MVTAVNIFSETEAPETETPETKAPETETPETETPETAGKRLTLRLTAEEHKLLNDAYKSSGASLNSLISDAIKSCYSGFCYKLATSNPISKGVDRYIFGLLKVKKPWPYYENPTISDKEIFRHLGVFTQDQLEAAFYEHIPSILFLARLISQAHPKGLQSLPEGIALHYLVFALLALTTSADELPSLAAKVHLANQQDSRNNINALRKAHGLDAVAWPDNL